ncbi:MAG: CRTAC1 family protein [Candidatus Limnocylindrales bacterium]
MSRRGIVGLVAAGAILAVVGVAAFGFVASRPGPATPTTALGAPHFVDETAAAGVSQTYDGNSAYAVGGGIAVFDCNGDGKPDMYIAGGSGPAALYRNDSPVGGALKFTALHDAATDLSNVEGAYPIDIDGDGLVDLAVLRLGETVLLRGTGDCHFERANEAWAFDGGNAYATAFSAKWEGSATLPTLAIGHYLKLDASGAPTLDCASDSQILRPKVDGTGFGLPIALSPGYCTLSMLFSDWDRSGRRDLRMTNDKNYYSDGSDQLWRVAPGEQPRLYTDADGWVSLQIFGMGIASYDVTGSGYPAYFITSQGDNRLQTLTSGPAQPAYRDIAFKRGVTAAQPFTGGDVLPSTAWQPEFQDVNNDGFIDLFVSKGNVSAEAGFAQKDPNDLMLGQPDGTFKEAADVAGVLNYARGRGAALADFNLDGMLDLVEANYGAPVKIWRNVGSGDASKPAQMGSWLAIRPSEPGPNRDAIGAWIEVEVGQTTLRRELTIGGGHVSGQLGWTHFGLGSAANARVRVQWPDGEMGPWMTVTANQFVEIQRGAAEAHPWAPPKS